MTSSTRRKCTTMTSFTSPTLKTAKRLVYNKCINFFLYIYIFFSLCSCLLASVQEIIHEHKKSTHAAGHLQKHTTGEAVNESDKLRSRRFGKNPPPEYSGLLFTLCPGNITGGFRRSREVISAAAASSHSHWRHKRF